MDLPLGGISALCGLSMLQDDPWPTFAATKAQERALELAVDARDTGLDEPEDPACVVQVLRYEPVPAPGCAVDPLSAILSLPADERDDPRVAGEIENVLTRVLGGDHEGIDKFKERFAGHDGEYVLIGGGACDLLFGEAGQDFRATKDLDLVLLVEALTPEFGQVFWDFVKEGGYENRQKSSGKPQFYRFSKPEDPAFPAMLELFARTDVGLRDAESGLMPIHIDDEVSSLSAILLDEEYYRLLVENRTSASGVAVLSVEGLIPFKAKAWLDLSARRAGGQAVDEKSVKKHRNDVCRLATLLAGGERPAMSEGVRADMRRFLEAYESDPVDPKALKIKGVGAQQVVEVLKSVYLR